MSEIGFDYKGKDEFKYGVIREFKHTDLWFEAITDDTDGFVLRGKDDSIIAVFPQEKRDEGPYLTDEEAEEFNLNLHLSMELGYTIQEIKKLRGSQRKNILNRIP